MLTPLDIHNKEFKRSLRGYDVNEVDDFLDQIIKDYEQLYKENMNLKDQIEGYKDSIARYRDLEDTLHSTLILAQQTAEEVKKNADKEAELILINARNKGDSIILEKKDMVVDLQNEYQDLQKTVHYFKAQFKSFLYAQLELVDEGTKRYPGSEEKEVAESTGE